MQIPTDEYDVPEYAKVMDAYGKFTDDIRSGKIVSAYALDRHGIVSAVSKMAFGNRMGVTICDSVDAKDLFAPAFGDIIAEVPADKVDALTIPYTVIGEVNADAVFAYKDVKLIEADAEAAWKEPLEKVFPTNSGAEGQEEAVKSDVYKASDIHICTHKIAQPTVFIPVFPGTNCEFDSAKAFERAGAKTIVKVFRNQNAADIVDSVDVFEKAIKNRLMIRDCSSFESLAGEFFRFCIMNPADNRRLLDVLNQI